MTSRRKTTRSQPSRSIWFDKADRERITSAAMKGFPWGVFNIGALPNSISQLELEGAPHDFLRGTGRPRKMVQTRGLSFHLFRPYRDAPYDAPDVAVWVEVRAIDQEKAKHCLNYLGFDETFKKKYLELCKTEPFRKSPDGRNHKENDVLDYMFPYLTNLSGEELRPVLVHDDRSAEKWEKRLSTCRTSWGDLRITKGATVSILCDLLKEESPGLSRDAVEKRFRRWKASRRGDNKKP